MRDWAEAVVFRGFSNAARTSEKSKNGQEALKVLLYEYSTARSDYESSNYNDNQGYHLNAPRQVIRRMFGKQSHQHDTHHRRKLTQPSLQSK
jgi:hypothetical protein